MDIQERSRLLTIIGRPIIVVLAPLFVYAVWNAPNPEGPDHIGAWGYVIFTTIGIVSLVIALFGTERCMNWLRRLKRM